jgi:hypothetical protein
LYVRHATQRTRIISPATRWSASGGKTFRAINFTAPLECEKTEENVKLFYPVLSTSDDPDDFEPISGRELALLKLRRRNRLSIMFDNDGARPYILGHQKLFD